MASSLSIDSQQLTTPMTNGQYHDIRIKHIPLSEGSRDELCHFILPHYFNLLIDGLGLRDQLGEISFVTLPVGKTEDHRAAGGTTACGFMRFKGPEVHAKATDSLNGVRFRGYALELIVNNQPPKIPATAQLTCTPTEMPTRPSKFFNPKYMDLNRRDVNTYIQGLNFKPSKQRKQLEAQPKRSLDSPEEDWDAEMAEAAEMRSTIATKGTDADQKTSSSDLTVNKSQAIQKTDIQRADTTTINEVASLLTVE